jgi:hypothetical protein
VGDRKQIPPSLGLWLLRHGSGGKHREALAGDLVERFREGQTQGWFWRQVLIACTVSALSAIRRRWPLVCYAIAGAIAMGFSPHPLISVSALLHWSDLPWPLSQIVFELSAPAVITLASLSVLGIVLATANSFHWKSLLRTWIANFALIAFGHYSLDMFPWLLRSVPGEPYRKVVIVPGAVQLILLVAAFLAAAWLGCPMEDADMSDEHTVAPQ